MKKNILKVIFFSFVVTITSFSIDDDEINKIFQVKSKDNKTLIVEQEVRAETVDPLLIRDTYSKRLAAYIYQQLLNLNENEEIEKGLLEKYEWVDKMKMYCKLKEDIYFYDGDEITSYDVKTSIEDLSEKGYMKASYDSIKEINVVNDKEFFIVLKYPDITLERALTNPVASIIKRSDGKIIGSGVYYIAETRQKSFVLRRNKYYEKGIYNFEKIEVRGELNSYQRILNSMRRPKYLTYDLYKEDIEKAEEIGAINKKMGVKEGQVFDVFSLLFGDNFEYSLEEKKAIESVIRRDIETVYPKELLLKTKDLNKLDYKLSKLKKEYSQEEAKQILKENGLDKRKIEIICLNTIHNREMAYSLIEDLEKAGLTVELKIYRLSRFLDRLRSRDYDIAVYNMTVNAKYLGTSLEKILIGDLASEELQDSTLPFISLLKQSENSEESFLVLDKVLYLIYSGRYFIPLEHKETYVLGNRDILKRMKE